MSDLTYTVQPGRSNPVGDALIPGTMLQNLDKLHAVWVSSNGGLMAGQGTKIGPLGSVTWQGGACYAVTDTGVTDPVNLTVTTSASNPVNPVDVGVAVATSLYSMGETVHAGKITAMPPQAGMAWILDADLGQYASVVLNLTSDTNQQLTIAWLDDLNQTISSQQVTLNALPTDNNSLGIQMDVKSNHLALYFTTVWASVTLNAYASNRPLSDKIIGCPPVYQSSINSMTWGPSLQAEFPNVFRTPGGLHHVSVLPNYTGATGYLIAELLSPSGAALNVTLVDTSLAKAGPYGEPELYADLTLPAGNYRFIWRNGNTSTLTYPVTLTILTPGF